MLETVKKMGIIDPDKENIIDHSNGASLLYVKKIDSKYLKCILKLLKNVENFYIFNLKTQLYFWIATVCDEDFHTGNEREITKILKKAGF